MSIAQTPDDLKNHLKEQLGFLSRSADAYDLGFHDEAKRLAVTIRVLLHDTANSKSLLDQMGQKNRLFYDTAMPDVQNNMISHSALIAMAMGKGGGVFVPLLDEMSGAMPPRQVTFDEWWQRPIFRNKDGQVLSRKQLVLAVANQDGGAHIDATLNDVYAKLSRTESTGWNFYSEGISYPIKEAELAAVRQIAHELLRTLDGSYQRKLKIPEGSVLVASPSIAPVQPGGTASGAPLPTAPITPLLRQSPKVGRNDPCPCGSGKKYKRCHGFQTK